MKAANRQQQEQQHQKQQQQRQHLFYLACKDEAEKDCDCQLAVTKEDYVEEIRIGGMLKKKPENLIFVAFSFCRENLRQERRSVEIIFTSSIWFKMVLIHFWKVRPSRIKKN